MSAERDEQKEVTPASPEARPPGAGPDALQLLCSADSVWSERYEGWEELGSGGYGTVVKTTLRGFDRVVAVKIFQRLGAEDRRRLLTEVETLATVSHPSIVRAFSPFDRGALVWLEMELVDGSSLGREIKRRVGAREPWPLVGALEIARCVAEGMAAVHALGVVHRDIKPDNILLPASREPAAKIADFGIARVMEAMSHTRSGVLPGSPRYMAPEVLDGNTALPASDIYSMAVTLYQVFAGGAYPLALTEAATIGEVLRAHRKKAPVPLRSLGYDVPESVADLIHRGLDKNPRNRPTAAVFARVMSDALARLRAASTPASATPAEATRSRAPLAVKALASVCGVLVLGGAWLAFESMGASPRPSAPSQPSTAPVAHAVQKGEPTPAGRVATAPSPAAAEAAGLLVRWSGPQVVEVVNGSGKALTRARVNVGGRAYEVGPMEVGEAVSVVVEGSGAANAAGEAPDGSRAEGRSER